MPPLPWGCLQSRRESSGLWSQKLPLTSVQHGARSLGEMLFSPWPLSQQGWSWRMHFNALSLFLMDLRLIREKRFFF